MKSKKGKAIAMELFDDILDDENEEQSQAGKGEQKDLSEEATKVASSNSLAEENLSDEPSLVDDDESIYAVADDSNPFGAEDTFSGNDFDLGIEDGGSSQPPSATDATIKLNESKIIPHPKTSTKKRAIQEATQVLDDKRKAMTAEASVTMSATSSNIKASVGRYVGAGGVSSPTQSTLVQSENLRVAQQKILELEEEISRLRTENEDLAAAGETLRKVVDESESMQENLGRRLENVRDLAQQEQQIMKESIDSKDKKIYELQNKIEEMETRLSTNIQKIRVRERELENRLELVKMEGQALARSKDELVLDLKRQVDQLNVELGNYRSKGHELNSQLKNKQELLRRTVKALRLALSMLEGDEEMQVSLKKVK